MLPSIARPGWIGCKWSKRRGRYPTGSAAACRWWLRTASCRLLAMQVCGQHHHPAFAIWCGMTTLRQVMQARHTSQTQRWRLHFRRARVTRPANARMCQSPCSQFTGEPSARLRRWERGWFRHRHRPVRHLLQWLGVRRCAALRGDAQHTMECPGDASMQSSARAPGSGGTVRSGATRPDGHVSQSSSSSRHWRGGHQARTRGGHRLGRTGPDGRASTKPCASGRSTGPGQIGLLRSAPAGAT